MWPWCVYAFIYLGSQCFLHTADGFGTGLCAVPVKCPHLSLGLGLLSLGSAALVLHFFLPLKTVTGGDFFFSLPEFGDF